MMSEDERASGCPDGKRSPPPINICNTKGISDALPTRDLRWDASNASNFIGCLISTPKHNNASTTTQVVYTWEMDFNRSVLGASTLLVPRTTPTASPGPGPAGMPAWAHNSWVCVFAAMLAVAILGNAIVIWIVTAHRRMRTVTNYFLVNLSLADLMMASLNCLFNFIYMLHSNATQRLLQHAHCAPPLCSRDYPTKLTPAHNYPRFHHYYNCQIDWVFGVRYCQLSNFIANVTVAASVFTLTGISFDRYQAIVRPMRPRMSKTCSLITIAVIWVSGMLLAIPCLLYSTTKEYSASQQEWDNSRLPLLHTMSFIQSLLLGRAVSPTSS
ncbi:hypothetical protein MSG28_003016 [Choristoneura fumiferana]|uniref:Uncharacterized protein n=1 Tax=Choristoneura fumiferana TaxID=7141 RepID=A0ACC0JKA1_CHOFU|nr:hypothetical protein MSG28_003016 [Choristoneura fumiferana]